MNAADAIRYLQALITMPKERMADGRRDPGWCCSEHALVLALALDSCGVSCQIAQGAVYIRTEAAAEDVTNHFFVVGVLRSSQVFDSSLRFPGISGVFPNYTPASIAVEIVSSTTDGTPPPYKFRNSPASAARVRYVHRSTLDSHEFLDRTSATPYGDWLTAQGVGHGHFWRAAATTTAAILCGEISLSKVLPEKEFLLHDTMRASRGLKPVSNTKLSRGKTVERAKKV